MQIGSVQTENARKVTGMLIDSKKLKQAILTIMPERSEVLLIVDNQTEGIVRCKDCKHHGKGTCGAAAGIAYPPPDEWFCADGEQK